MLHITIRNITGINKNTLVTDIEFKTIKTIISCNNQNYDQDCKYSHYSWIIK